MIKQVINEELKKIIADMCRKIADREWIKKLISETPMVIKALSSKELKAELEKETNEEKRAKLLDDLQLCQRHEQDLVDLTNCERSLASDVNSYKVLSGALDEITNLLK